MPTRVDSGVKVRRTLMTKGCLYCGLQLPETTRFCPQCGRPIEVAIRVDSGVKMRRTTMAKGCLSCSLQLPETAEFCPRCGRPIERGFVVRPVQESEFDCFRKEMKRKDDLVRQQGFYYPRLMRRYTSSKGKLTPMLASSTRSPSR